MRTPPKTSQAKNIGADSREGFKGLVGALPLPLSFLSIAGAVFGIAGALILALPARPGLGFAAFIVSNLAWLIVSGAKRQWPLHVQQWIFLVCSVVGLWNWWLGPLMLG